LKPESAPHAPTRGGSAAAPQAIHRAIHFYAAPIGKKVVMAVTGLILFGYVLGHMAGNLQIFAPDHDQINRYAAFLHSTTNFAPLWIIRLVLLAAVVWHIVAALQLTKTKSDARPVGYVKKRDVPTAYAARTMMWSGPIVAAFVIFHVLHLTVGSVMPLREVGPNQPDVRYNIVSGFQNPLVAGFYILAMGLLCMHLYHGLWSLWQSLGWIDQQHNRKIKNAAGIVAILICAGFVSVPLAVLAGVVSY
jgi:succinate dehydrogenase / fumarate reductase, cytochrome b subunit